jgi:hypothetical protein
VNFRVAGIVWEWGEQKMDISSEDANQAGSKPMELPPVGKHVLVDCKGFRCLGFLDHDGKWKDVFRQEELPNVESWEHL